MLSDVSAMVQRSRQPPVNNSCLDLPIKAHTLPPIHPHLPYQLLTHDDEGYYAPTRLRSVLSSFVPH